MLTTQVAIELVKCLPWLREGKMVPLLAGGGGEGGMGMGMGGARSYINHKYKAF